jgi:ribose 1,5-bisphosphokinase PhnN
MRIIIDVADVLAARLKECARRDENTLEDHIERAIKSSTKRSYASQVQMDREVREVMEEFLPGVFDNQDNPNFTPLVAVRIEE